MKNNYKEVLLNSYLAISDTTSGLKDIAYAKLFFFMLFLETKSLKMQELKRITSDLVGSISIPEESAKKAVDLLKARKLIAEKDCAFSLLEEERKKVSSQIKYSKEISEKICTKYFSTSISLSTIRQWFDEVNEKYFSTFADKLVELYNNKQSLILDVEKVLDPIISKHKLKKQKGNLIQGYKEFLLSNNREEEEKIWNMMQSLLAARIISADLSPDFLSIDKYKDSEIILDTNVLFENSLASHKNLDGTIESFGKVAKTIGSKLYITKETIEEYETVWAKNKDRMITLWSNYSIGILHNSGNKSGFFRSLIESGCESTEDVERFFSVIKDPPKDIGGSAVKTLDEAEYNDISYDVQLDQSLFQQIKDVWTEFHHDKWNKPNDVIVHDLLLTKICNKLSKKRKIFILTLDISLEALSLRWINEKEDPIWRSLFSLVQILAINGGGPEFNLNDLAPLVKTFIEQEELGRSDDYDERDLLLLPGLNNRIDELSETKIVVLLNKVHKARLLGSGNEQAIKDIKLELERSLLKKTQELNETISEKNQAIGSLEEKLTDVEVENLKHKKYFAWQWFFVKSFLFFSISFLIFMFIGNELQEEYSLGKIYNTIQMLLFVFTPLGLIIRDYKKTKNKLK